MNNPWEDIKMDVKMRFFKETLELRICREFFRDKVTVLKSKAYSDKEL